MRDRDNELVVVKANQMIQQYKYTLSKLEIRVVNTIIANIKSPKYDEELNIMEFDIREFCKMLGIADVGGEQYKRIKKTLQDLSNKSSDYINFGKYQTIVRWIERPIFEEGSGKVKLKLDDLLKPFLLRASGSIQAKLRYYFEMDSKYAMRLYELLKSYDGFKFAKFEVEELKLSIDATKKSYQNFALFRTTVLEPAIEEINKVTDLIVSYSVRTSGRKITHVDFTIDKKKNAAVILESADVDNDAITVNEYDTIIENEIKEKTADPELISRMDFFRPLIKKINPNWDMTDIQLSYIVQVLRESIPYGTYFSRGDLDTAVYDLLNRVLLQAKAEGGGKKGIYNWLKYMFANSEIIEQNLKTM